MVYLILRKFTTKWQVTVLACTPRYNLVALQAELMQEALRRAHPHILLILLDGHGVLLEIGGDITVEVRV